MTALVVSVTGALGALARYLLSGWIQELTFADYPFGTMVVNVTGSFALGLVAGGLPVGSAASVAAAGFLGGFTTFSTWMLETVRLGVPGRSVRATLNLLLTLVAGIGLCACGYALAI